MAGREKIRKVIKSPTNMNPEISRLAGELKRRGDNTIHTEQTQTQHSYHAQRDT